MFLFFMYLIITPLTFLSLDGLILATLLCFNRLSAFFHHIHVQRLLHIFNFYNLILHYNVGVLLFRLNIHSANVSKNDLVFFVIVYVFDWYLCNAHPKQFHCMVWCKTEDWLYVHVTNGLGLKLLFLALHI